MISEHGIDRLVRFLLCHGDDNAFAGGKPVGFDNNRSSVRGDVRVCLCHILKRGVLGCRNLVALHEGFGKVLGTFQLRRFSCGSENREIFRPKDIDDAFGKRCFGTDDRQGDVLFGGKVRQGLNVGNREIFKGRIGIRTGIARGYVNPGNVLALSQAPG